MREPTAPRLAMIGFDGADLDYVKSALRSLPNFRRALESGAARTVRSSADLLAGSVWPSFFTTKTPGEHGIYHIVQWDPEAMRIRRVTIDPIRHEPFWRKLDRRGLKVIAVDVPLAVAAKTGHGIEISSWGAHDTFGPPASFPEEVVSDILRNYGPHPMGLEIPVEMSLHRRMKVRDKLVMGARMKSEIMRRLLTSHEWDLFIGVFGETHRGGHILWPDGKTPARALLEVYRALDTALGEVLAAIDLERTTVMLFSLHGMTDNSSQDHLVAPLMDRINDRFAELEPGLYPSGRPPRQRSLMRVLRKRVPPSLQTMIANMVPQSMRDAVIDRAATAGHDWKHTPGLVLRADNSSYLRFNIRGREREGMLEPGSGALARYEKLIRDSFASLRTFDGTRLVRDVSGASEHFHGEAEGILPDLIIRWAQVAPAMRVDSCFGPLTGDMGSGRGGNHHPDGFLITLEPGARRDGTAAAIGIEEIGPMIMRMLLDHS